VLPNLFKAAGLTDPDGFPDSPALLPDDLKLEYTDAYWKSLGWQETTWLGEPVRRSAADLVAFQEMLSRVRPDLILNVHAPGTSLAPFLASLCDLLGQGDVLAIGPDPAEHARIQQIPGDPLSEDVFGAVRERVATAPRALVVLGSSAKFQRTLDEFAAYAPFVPVDSYVVIENTIIGGRPVWPSFGTGPGEAVAAILGGPTQDFTPDLSLERFGVTFNPRGWLRRVGD
jgi:cephalosporin hydroxylase